MTVAAQQGLTPDQIEFRQHTVGSSDIPALAGLNPWKKPIDVFLEKAGRTKKQERKATKFGHLIEKDIAQVYGEDHGCDLQMVGTAVRPDRPWQSATADRVVFGARAVEIKLVGRRVAHHWDDGVPVYVTAQVMWQLDVLGSDRLLVLRDGELVEIPWQPIREAHVAALICGTEYVCEPITYDPDTAAGLREIGERFHRDHIETGRPPTIDESNRWREYFRDLWPKPRRQMERAPDDVEALAHQVLDAKSRMERAKREKETFENELMAKTCDREGWRGDGWRLLWKTDKNGTRRFDLRERNRP